MRTECVPHRRAAADLAADLADRVRSAGTVLLVWMVCQFCGPIAFRTPISCSMGGRPILRTECVPQTQSLMLRDECVPQAHFLKYMFSAHVAERMRSAGPVPAVRVVGGRCAGFWRFRRMILQQGSVPQPFSCNISLQRAQVAERIRSAGRVPLAFPLSCGRGIMLRKDSVPHEKSLQQR